MFPCKPPRYNSSSIVTLCRTFLHNTQRISEVMNLFAPQYCTATRFWTVTRTRQSQPQRRVGHSPEPSPCCPIAESSSLKENKPMYVQLHVKHQTIIDTIQQTVRTHQNYRPKMINSIFSARPSEQPSFP